MNATASAKQTETDLMLLRDPSGVACRNSSQQLRSLDLAGDFDVSTLKARFLVSLKGIAYGVLSLKSAVNALLDRNISPATMIGWAVAAGFTERYARSMVSRVCCAKGRRRNVPGQGRKHLPEALELLNHAVSQYGEETAVRVLGAAHRLGQRRLQARRNTTE